MPVLDPTRSSRLTASCFPMLMGGDEEKQQRLYLEKSGDPRFVPDGFTDSWTAKFGMLVEPFALDFYAEKTGMAFTRRGEQLFHPDRDFVSCTLDAYRAADDCVMDVKTMHDHVDLGERIAYLTPQILCQMECCHAERGAILVVKGGAEPFEVPVYFDETYREAVWKTVDRFWQCIESLTPPFPLSFPQVVPPEKWRTIDLDAAQDQPNWAEDMRTLLGNWSATEADAKLHEASKIEIKKLFPDDCGKLTCSGLIISRARNNAVKIQRAKAERK